MKIKFMIIIAAFAVLMSCGSGPSVSGSDELDLAIRDASDYLNDNIPKGSMIVILNMQSDSMSLSEYIIDELIANAVNDKVFKVVDRQQLDLIRTEQNFQLTTEVDDTLAISIGKFFGAQTIVSGKVSQVGERYRMTLRALEVQTAQVQGQYNRNIAAGKTITELMRSGGGSDKGAQSTTTRTTSSAASTSGTTGGASTRSAPTVTSVTVSPDSVNVNKGKAQEFTATISGTNDPDATVTWAVTGNTSSKTNISEDGILSVADDKNITPLTVTATSTVDTSKKATATVAVPGGISAINVNNAATWNTAINKIRNGGNGQSYIINVSGNVSVPAPPTNENIFGSVTGITVTLQGRGTISISVDGILLRLAAGQTVVIRNVTLRGRSGNDSPLVFIGDGSIFRMEDSAVITGNTSPGRHSGSQKQFGGGVFISGGTFIMQDRSSVTGNIAGGTNYYSDDVGGGGVHLRSGSFIMQGGIISGNASDCWVGGGGVYIGGGTFTMEGGSISGNSATNKGHGGGVCVNGGTFIMKGGTISSNTALESAGGGVAVKRGTFTMQGGTVTGGNNAKNNGGGVYIGKGTSFIKTGGTISGNDISFSDRNIASNQGHAVYWETSPIRWRNATAGPDEDSNGYGFWLND